MLKHTPNENDIQRDETQKNLAEGAKCLSASEPHAFVQLVAKDCYGLNLSLPGTKSIICT